MFLVKRKKLFVFSVVCFNNYIIVHVFSFPGHYRHCCSLWIVHILSLTLTSYKNMFCDLDMFQEQQDDLDFQNYRDYQDDGQDSGHITPDINDLDPHQGHIDTFNGVNYAKTNGHASHMNGTVNSSYQGHSQAYQGQTQGYSQSQGYSQGHRGSQGSISGYSGVPLRQHSQDETFQRQLPVRMSSQQPYYQQVSVKVISMTHVVI